MRAGEDQAPAPPQLSQGGNQRDGEGAILMLVVCTDADHEEIVSRQSVCRHTRTTCQADELRANGDRLADAFAALSPSDWERTFVYHAEGERTLPQAGLIFFQYRGKTQSIHSIELIYAGPAGKATLALQP